jgi:aryl-alcohol dehydrogenase-like predicted oxidoreductase
MTPVHEIVRVFDDLMRGGKVHYAGLSNFPEWRTSRADLLAELIYGLRRWVAVIASYWRPVLRFKN